MDILKNEKELIRAAVKQLWWESRLPLEAVEVANKIQMVVTPSEFTSSVMELVGYMAKYHVTKEEFRRFCGI